MAKKLGKAVLVTTAHRGVFFGYLESMEDKVVTLKNARCCVYWSADVKGFLGLANSGPSNSCKIGPHADIMLHDVTCVANCTPQAVEAWESAPWK